MLYSFSEGSGVIVLPCFKCLFIYFAFSRRRSLDHLLDFGVHYPVYLVLIPVGKVDHDHLLIKLPFRPQNGIGLSWLF